MQCYSELVPPSAITHAISLHFVSEDECSLVVAKTSLLQVFELRHGKPHNKSAHLSLLGEYELSGTVTALQRVKTKDSQSNTESLLIASRNAKISLVRWDHDNHRIATTSIHYYENDLIPRQPCDTGVTFLQSILTVDPNSRCVALKFGLRQLAILPFKQHGEDLQELDEEMADTTAPEPDANGEELETPYKKSFVLSLPSLDEELTDLVDIAFLHNYREPTFGILSSNRQASWGLYTEDKYSFTYRVLTLDLEQAASTVLATVENLPIDLWKIVPLPSPIGGALLVGTNEVIHVAQSGKIHAIAVNEFADLNANYTVTEQSSLAFKLEDCVTELLDAEAGDILFTLRDGTIAVLHLTLLGPDVKAMKFRPTPLDAGGNLLQGMPSCAVVLSSQYIFVGSDEADSYLLQSHHVSLSRKRSHADMLGQDDSTAVAENDEEDDLEDDDLYGGTARKTRSSKQTASASQAVAYRFELVDTLPNIGPINTICFGRSSAATDTNKVEMVATTGRQRGSYLSKLTRDLRPQITKTYTFEQARSVWTVHAIKPKGKKSLPTRGPDNLLFVSTGPVTRAYKLETLEAEPEELVGTEFEQDGKTTNIGTLGQGRWVVHCRRAEIRVYEPDLSLSQIIPMVDDNTDTELEIVSTNFCEPYVMVIRSDSSVQILKHETKTHDVEPIDLPLTISQQKYVSGSLYKAEQHGGHVSALMLLDDGSLQILSLPKLECTYTVQSPGHLPAILSSDAKVRRAGQKDTLTEVLMADLGPRSARKSYLIFRNATDELAFYEPFYSTPSSSKSWTSGLKFRKVPVPYLPTYNEESDQDNDAAAQLQIFNLGDQNVVRIPGNPPSLVFSEPHSRPKILRVHVPDVRSVIATGQLDDHAVDSQPSFGVLTDAGQLHQCQLSADISLCSGWVAERMPFHLNEESAIQRVTFHEECGMYVVSTCRLVDFNFVADDTRHPEQDDITLRPQVQQHAIHLYSAKSRRIINSHEFQPGEEVTSVEVISMDISEHTHEVKPMICVGLALLRGEDMPARGSLVVFQVLPVVSEPDDPETGIKLHIQSREDMKGAVTTIAPFVGGLVGISQGQKIMVRGLKEDGSCLPVAFLDCQCQLATLKTLWKTGLWLAGDSWKGLWLGGFTEDPYKLTFLGKSRPQMEVVCAEFLPFEDQLFVLAVDADMDLHVLQYDPEDPKTVAGTRLLHRGTFNIGHWPTSMTLVPSTLAPASEQAMASGNGNGDAGHQTLFYILITTQSGSIGIVTPLDSTAYRRLGNIHGQLVSILEHPAALNPRQYRAAESDTAGARGIIDGMLLQRVDELGHAKKAEVLARCGSDAWTMRSDLEIISGGGLTWL